ncbi:MAG: hypothetical protein AB1774_01650 [Bacillota bacterium]
MSTRLQVGFNQRVQLDWLEQTAKLVLAGNDRKGIEAALCEVLKGRLSVGGTSKRGNREKTVSILLKIWVSVSDELRGLRDGGLDLLRQMPANEHLPIHWGMTMAVYPFVSVVAEAVGRLARLQGSVSLSQVQRRLREQFGERETVSRAARRVMRCFVDWGVLKDVSKQGVYERAPVRAIKNEQLAAWLIETTLIASGSEARPLRQLLSSPALFPFSLDAPTSRAVESGGRLLLYRQGLDEDVVVVKTGG